MDTRRYYNEQVLAHASHKYITRKWKNGKWVYTYADDAKKSKYPNAKIVADAKAQQEAKKKKAAEQAKLEAEKKKKYEAERKAKLAAAGKARQEAGLKDAEKRAAEEAKTSTKIKKQVQKGKDWATKTLKNITEDKVQFDKEGYVKTISKDASIRDIEKAFNKKDMNDVHADHRMQEYLVRTGKAGSKEEQEAAQKAATERHKKELNELQKKKRQEAEDEARRKEVDQAILETKEKLKRLKQRKKYDY